MYDSGVTQSMFSKGSSWQLSSKRLSPSHLALALAVLPVAVSTALLIMKNWSLAWFVKRQDRLSVVPDRCPRNRWLKFCPGDISKGHSVGSPVG